MRPSGSVSADGFPSVIMMVCRMSLRCDSNMRRDSLSPSAVFVWYGPTWARASWASGISSAVSWNSTTRRVSPGNCVRIRWVSASATFFAGVKRSSPYRIIECEQSSISTGAEQRLLAGGHLGRLGDVQIALVDQFLDDLVQQLGELALQVGVARGVAGRFAPQHLEHLGSELPGFHQRLEDRLAQRVERPVGLVLAELPPEGMRVRASGEARLEQEVGELIEQGLEVDRVGQLGEVAAVRRVFHRAPYPKYRAAASFPAMDEAARGFRFGALAHRT